MNTPSLRRGHVAVGVAALLLSSFVATSACAVDDIPECVGNCFEFEVLTAQVTCTSANHVELPINFNGHNGGYYGRACTNASAVPLAADAINTLRNGGTLAGLDPATLGGYQEVVGLVLDAIEAQCMIAASGQCTKASKEEVCGGVRAAAYAALITNETCILEPSGLGRVEEESCNFNQVFYGTDDGGTDDACTDPTMTDGSSGGADGTTGSVDGTTGGSEAGDSTTSAMAGPWGDLEALVSCDPQTDCEIDRELLFNVSANFDVFTTEGVTLNVVGSSTSCGPGAQIGGIDSGEDVEELADAFDFRNGDIVFKVDTITIQDFGDALKAAEHLSEPSGTTTVVVKRPTSAGCTTLSYDLEVI